MDRQSWTNAIRNMVLLWLAWLCILLIYQGAVTARYQVQRPDRVLSWTALAEHEPLQANLKDPFMNAQVAWDSEFYLSIALQGYDDPQVRVVPPQPSAVPPFNRPLSLNYAFFPGYPYLMRWVSVPLKGLGLTPLATATLSGVLISALGTLGGMIALYDLTQRIAGKLAGDRAVFYLLSFPTSFFLTQVYTEGLFIGLSFGCLAFLQRKQWLIAGLLATLATLTRPVGVLLTLPLVLLWLKSLNRGSAARYVFFPRVFLQLVVSVLPFAVHLLWKHSFWGGAFQIVEKSFFKCQLLNLPAAFAVWSSAFLTLFGDNPAAVVYYLIEFLAILFGFISCFITLYRYPTISVYGLMILTASTTCGTAWSLSRYLLTVPSVFLVLGDLGRSDLFDRVWSLASILFLAMLTALFSFNFWVG